MISYKSPLFFLVIASLTFLPACWPFGKTQVSQKEQSLYLINVLDKTSFDDCSIKGSTHVPFEQVEDFAKKLDRNAHIVVYCANYACSASATAAEQLKKMGFQNVWAYEGGTAEWYQLGLENPQKYPIEGSCKAGYLTAPNEKSGEIDYSIPDITAEELSQKMLAHGLISPK